MGRRACWALVLLAAPAFGQVPAGAPPALREARIVAESGDVFVRPGGKQDFYLAPVDTPLEAQDAIQTSAAGECDIALDGGSLLHLERGTSLEVDSLEARGSRFTVSVGGLLGKVVGADGQPADMEFHTPAAWGGIRGTEFSVEAAGTRSRFGVFDEGKLAVHQGDREVLLTPHTELAAQAGSTLGAAQPLETPAERAADMERVRRTRAAVSLLWKPLTPAARREARDRVVAHRPVSPLRVTNARRQAERRLDEDFRRPRPSAASAASPRAPSPSRREDPRRRFQWRVPGPAGHRGGRR